MICSDLLWHVDNFAVLEWASRLNDFGGGLIFGWKFVLVIRGLTFGGAYIRGGLHSGFYGIWLAL